MDQAGKQLNTAFLDPDTKFARDNAFSHALLDRLLKLNLV